MIALEETIAPEIQTPCSARRLGRFRVPASALVRWPALHSLMSEMVVVKVEYDTEELELEYTAFCPRFSTCLVDEVPPLYEYRIERGDDGELKCFMRKTETPA